MTIHPSEDRRPEREIHLLYERNTSDITAEEMYAWEESLQELQSKLDRMQQMICELLARNQQLRMQLASAKSRGSSGSSSHWNGL